MKVVVLITMPDGMKVEVDGPKEILDGNAPFGWYLKGYDENGNYVNVNGSLVSRSFIREQHLHPRKPSVNAG